MLLHSAEKQRNRPAKIHCLRCAPLYTRDLHGAAALAGVVRLSCARPGTVASPLPMAVRQRKIAAGPTLAGERERRERKRGTAISRCIRADTSPHSTIVPFAATPDTRPRSFPSGPPNRKGRLSPARKRLRRRRPRSALRPDQGTSEVWVSSSSSSSLRSNKAKYSRTSVILSRPRCARNRPRMSSRSSVRVGLLTKACSLKPIRPSALTTCKLPSAVDRSLASASRRRAIGRWA